MARNHKQNSNFQITYFLAGACHTADGAYSLLCDLKEEREASIASYKVNLLKQQAKKIMAEKMLEGDEVSKLEGQAELLEIENNSKNGKILYEAALDELNHINKCIKAVEPLRKYSNKTDLEAHELAQQEEWKLELIHRAENYMITSGSIPADHFVTMRMHPEFTTEILPRIENMMELMKINDPVQMAKLLEPNFNLPKLLKNINEE